MHNRHVIIPNKMKRENMPEMTYRHITLMVWSVTKNGESNRLNKFAESNIDLVNGMKRSAAALAATGTTYQDAFALFTGAQEVVQNAEVTGRALRSISMRMHGYSESSEDGLMEVDEELKNITGDLIDLTKTAEHSQGVSIFKEGSSTEFKSLVEYFGEINKIWDEMSQVQQNAFLDKAFGKNQANIMCLCV